MIKALTFWIVPIFTLFIFKFYPNLPEDAYEVECPFCYGTSGCELVSKSVRLDFLSLRLIYNHYSDYQKIYRAWNIRDKSVVAVKMHYNPKSIICGILNDSPQSPPGQCLIPEAKTTHEITVNLLMHSQSINGTKFCSRDRKNIEDFLKAIEDDDPSMSRHEVAIYTLAAVALQSELMFLKLFQEQNWRAPISYGACGRLFVVEWVGPTISEKRFESWEKRVKLAGRIFQLAKNLTSGHPRYSFYWTDFSADNLAVDDKGDVMFVDYDNVIIVDRKSANLEKQHTTEIIYILSGTFAFYEAAICGAQNSDHNYYALCYELLHPTTVAEHFEGGLLHSPPPQIAHKLLNLFDECIKPKNLKTRLEAINKIQRLITKSLIMYKI